MNIGSKLKAIVILFTVALLPYGVRAATTENSKTKLEVFQQQTGSVMIKGYKNIGEEIFSIEPSANNLQVIAMEFKSAATQKTMSGIVIEITGISTRTFSVTGSARSFIDYDEIEDLLKGLDYISQASADITKYSNFEVKYSTRGNFSATTFNDGDGNIKAAIDVGHLSSHLTMDKFLEFNSLIFKAKSKIDALK